MEQKKPDYVLGDYVRAINPPITPAGGGCAGDMIHDQKRRKVQGFKLYEVSGRWDILLSGRSRWWPGHCFAKAEPPPQRKAKPRNTRFIVSGQCLKCKGGPPTQLSNRTVRKLGLIPPRGTDLKKVAYMFCPDCSAVSVVRFIKVVTVTSTEVVIGKFPKVWDWAAGKK